MLACNPHLRIFTYNFVCSLYTQYLELLGKNKPSGIHSAKRTTAAATPYNSIGINSKGNSFGVVNLRPSPSPTSKSGIGNSAKPGFGSAGKVVDFMNNRNNEDTFSHTTEFPSSPPSDPRHHVRVVRALAALQRESLPEQKPLVTTI